MILNLTITEEQYDEILNKVPGILDSVGKWFQYPEVKDLLAAAGTIGNLVNLGLAIYRIYERKKSRDLKSNEKAFGALIRLILKSAKTTLSNNDFSIERFNNDRKKDLLSNLFLLFSSNEYNWDHYLPNHDVVSNFRNSLFNFLLESELNNVQISKILVDFNQSVLQNAEESEEIAEFYSWNRRNENYNNLIKYLEFTKTTFKYEISNVDKIPWFGTYLPSNYAILPMDTWTKDYTRIPSHYESEWDEEVFLNKENSGKWLTIIGAPFGVGKTSAVKYLTIHCAEKILKNPENTSNFIPVFVRLRYGFKNVYNDWDLDKTLENILSHGDEKKRKILLICDGLDEYIGDISILYRKLTNYIAEKSYPNMKIIITTRLKAGWTNLFDANYYIRLFPFKVNQINDYFTRYFGQKDVLTYEKLKEKYALGLEEIGKPLFCWMIAVTYSNEFSNYKIPLEGEIGSVNAKRALIYQQFVHSVVMGRHKSEKNAYMKFFTTLQYDEDIEKKVLRKMAMLKQIYPTNLTLKLATDNLNEFKLPTEIVKSMLEPILTSYFYLQSDKIVSEDNMLIDFMHRSLEEYLVAEYYVESLFISNKPYRLSIGIPSVEVMKFLNGVLELFSTDNDSIKDYLLPLIDSLYDPDSENVVNLYNRGNSDKFHDARDRLITNSKLGFIKNLLVTNRISGMHKFEDFELWRTQIIDESFQDLIFHQWLSLFIYDKLITYENAELDHHIGKEEKLQIEKLCKVFLGNLPNYLVKFSSFLFVDIDLPKAVLPEADLSGANLTRCNLKYANLFRTDFTGANLNGATLTGATLKSAVMRGTLLTNVTMNESVLSDAILEEANLRFSFIENADLINSNLRNANLQHSSLSKTKLNDAILYGSKMHYSDLIEANLTNAILVGANLTEADLSGANLSGADLTNAILVGAILTGADLTNAILVGADLTKPESSIRYYFDPSGANLTNAILVGANLSGADLTEADLSGANLSGADLTNAILVGANLTGANLSGADLTNTNLYTCNLTAVENLPFDYEEAHRRGAKY
jgi:uncharacterized protein YjbI with pentapeptide repeats